MITKKDVERVRDWYLGALSYELTAHPPNVVGVELAAHINLLVSSFDIPPDFLQKLNVDQQHERPELGADNSVVL